MEKTVKTTVAGDSRTKRIVTTALLAALSCVATMVIKIPSPTGGYMNLGDTMVLLGAFLLGPWYGALAGGVGSAMADLLSGYPVYVPATLVIKAVMAVVAGLLYRKLWCKTGRMKGSVIAALAGEVPMVVGYWLFDALLMGSFAGSAVGIPSNLVQAGFGIVVSVLLAASLYGNEYVRKEFPNL